MSRSPACCSDLSNSKSPEFHPRRETLAGPYPSTSCQCSLLGIPWAASQASHSSLPLGIGYLVSTTVKASPYHESLRETYSSVLRRAGILHTLAEDNELWV